MEGQLTHLYMTTVSQNLQTPKVGTSDVVVGDIVIAHDNKHPDVLWKLARIDLEKLLPGPDGNVRGAFIKRNGHSSVFKRRHQQLYPLKVRSVENMSSPDE